MYNSGMKLQKGFTLVEVVIIAGLIGILTTILFASFINIRENARDKARISDIQNIRLALEDYYSICRNYPETLTSGASNCSRGTLSFSDVLPEVPTDPNTGNEYVYFAMGDSCFDYHLAAELEGGGFGLEQDQDFDSTSETACHVSGNGFVGTDDPDQLYDFTRFSG